MFSISKGNVFIAAAVAALGVSLTAAKPAVAETMLDQYTVKSMGIAQVGGYGKCLVIVTVNSGVNGADEVRVVADNKGSVKLYGSIGDVEALIKSCKVDASTVILIKRQSPVETLTSPVRELIKLHRDAVRTRDQAVANMAPLSVERSTAQGLNWDISAEGSLKRQTYDSMVLVLASIDESRANAATAATAYAAQLTTAGINPATYLPIA